LNLEKLKENNLKKFFFAWCDLRKVKRKKIEEKNAKKTCVIMRKFSFQI